MINSAKEQQLFDRKIEPRALSPHPWQYEENFLLVKTPRNMDMDLRGDSSNQPGFPVMLESKLTSEFQIDLG